MARKIKNFVERAMATQSGRDYWRSIQEKDRSAQFIEAERPEFPAGADSPEGWERRDFMKLLGASTLAASTAACWVDPTEKVLPHTTRPPEGKPGLPLHYATSMTLDGYALGLLVRSNEGRPTKVDGNPDHPASAISGQKLGASTIFSQASVLSLYDPHRAKGVWQKAVPNAKFARKEDKAQWMPATFDALCEAIQTSKGRLRFLLEPQSSPFLASLIARVQAKFPEAKFTYYTPVSRQNVFEGAKAVFGRNVETQYDFSKADVVVSLDADFTSAMPFSPRWARQFADKRRVTSVSSQMNRLYMAETMPSPTGSLADHRLRATSGQIGGVAAALLGELAALGKTAPGVGDVSALAGALTEKQKDWVKKLAKDLNARTPGATLVIAGDRQSPAVHAMAHALNTALGNVGSTVSYTDVALYESGSEGYPLKSLINDLTSKSVDALIILEGNPAYNAPADLNISQWIPEAPISLYMGQFENETAKLCNWFAASANYLESWGDARAYDGTISLIQPLIAPLYGGRTASELLLGILSDTRKSLYQQLRDFWAKGGPNGAALGSLSGPGDVTKPEAPKSGFALKWDELVQKGVVENTAFAALSLSFNGSGVAGLLSAPKTAGIELNLVASYTVYDGRFANNGWLQELPQPMVSLTWDNALYLSAKTAAEKSLSTGDTVNLSFEGKALQKKNADGQDEAVAVPVMIMPGHAEGAATLHLGYGRSGEGEQLAKNIGVNIYPVRTAAAMYVGSAEITPTKGDKHRLALTQVHWTINAPKDRIDDRPIVAPMVTLEQYQKETAKLQHEWEELKIEALERRKDKKGNPLPALDLLPEQSPINHLYDKDGKPVPPEKYTEADKERLSLISGVPPLVPNPAEVRGFGAMQWAMVIDSSVCTGCNACVVACQSENNIAVVGKTQVLRSREMHWMRIDRYFVSPKDGTDDWQDDPEIVHQPQMCQQCEKAPCEYVCPVHATVHSSDGLNEMIYNRCIGTRFCLNNCPYKARRFNFFNYVDKGSMHGIIDDTSQVKYFGQPSVFLGRNPEVTIRARGVMEKCTYCVQRIRAADIVAQREGREIKDGEVVTACQESCPTHAIAFGSLTHQDSEVVKWKERDQTYSVLNKLGTRPRTEYSMKIANPNPELKTVLVEEKEAH